MRKLIDRVFLSLGRDVLSRSPFRAVNRALFLLALSGLGVGNYTPEMTDERRALRNLRARLPAAPTIFDVGANVGQFASVAREVFPEATIYSFDPNPTAFASLSPIASRLGIIAVNVGLSDTVGRLTMYDAGTGGSTTATLIPGVIHSPVEFEVPVTTLDAFASSEDIERVHFIKIDVEGNEVNVLRGARQTIEKHSPIVQMEFNEMNLVSRTALIDLQRELPGYKIFRILFSGDLLDISEDAPVWQNLYMYQNIIAIR